MNNILANIIDTKLPQFNKNVTDGNAKKVMRSLPAFLDNIIKSSIKSLSAKADLTYDGYRRLTPSEEFSKLHISNNGNKTNHDLAVSSLYLIELTFTYQGQKLHRPLYLPYAEDGNIMNISNTPYSIVPVLSDTVISPSHKEVFVRLLKDKLTFRSLTRNIILNGERSPKQIVNTNIVKVNPAQITDNIGKPLTSVSLYLLGEYGIRESVYKYSDAKEVLVTMDNVDHLRDRYNVYESTKIRHRSLKEIGYTGHRIKILIPKEVVIGPFLDNFITGIIYTLDILPEHSDDFIEVFNNADIEEEKLYWRILLGRITYKNSYSIDRITVDMEEHFETLQGYLDTLVKQKLKENSIYVDNFFDLLAIILTNYNSWLLNSKEYNSDISNRYIDMPYYLLYDIIVGFNKVILSINKRVQKKAPSYSEISKIMISELSPRKIFSLVKSQAVNLCISLVDNTTDNKYTKITALLEDRLVFSYLK